MLAVALLGAFAATASPAVALPPGFTERTIFTGLDHPTAVRFAPDGRVFVAEKSGLVRVFDSLTDTTPTHVRRPAHRTSTTSGTAGCSRWRSTLPSRRVRTSICRTPTTRRSAAPLRAGASQVRPRTAARRRRARRPTAVSSAAGSRACRSRRPTRWSDPRSCWCTTGASSSRATRSATSCSGPTERSTRVAARARPSTRTTGDNSGAEPAARRRATRAAIRRAGSERRGRRPPPRAARCAHRTCARRLTRSRSTAA